MSYQEPSSSMQYGARLNTNGILCAYDICFRKSMSASNVIEKAKYDALQSKYNSMEGELQTQKQYVFLFRFLWLYTLIV